MVFSAHNLKAVASCERKIGWLADMCATHYTTLKLRTGPERLRPPLKAQQNAGVAQQHAPHVPPGHQPVALGVHCSTCCRQYRNAIHHPAPQLELHHKLSLRLLQTLSASPGSRSNAAAGSRPGSSLHVVNSCSACGGRVCQAQTIPPPQKKPTPSDHFRHPSSKQASHLASSLIISFRSSTRTRGCSVTNPSTTLLLDGLLNGLLLMVLG